MTDPDLYSDPTPMKYGQAGCPACVRTGVGQWGSCPGEPVVAGYLDVTEWVPVGRRGRYREFACRDHSALLQDPRPMSDEDRAELTGRQVQAGRALAGERYMRAGPVDDYDQQED